MPILIARNSEIFKYHSWPKSNSRDDSVFKALIAIEHLQHFHVVAGDENEVMAAAFNKMAEFLRMFTDKIQPKTIIQTRPTVVIPTQKPPLIAQPNPSTSSNNNANPWLGPDSTNQANSNIPIASLNLSQNVTTYVLPKKPEQRARSKSKNPEPRSKSKNPERYFYSRTLAQSPTPSNQPAASTSYKNNQPPNSNFRARTSSGGDTAQTTLINKFNSGSLERFLLLLIFIIV